MSRQRERVDPKLLATHLNTLPAPQRYDRSLYFGPKAKVLHARSARRVHQNLKPLGDTRSYKAGIRAWSAQPGPEALRRGEWGEPHPRMEHQLRHVRDLVDVAPKGAPVLYRGVRLTPEQIAAHSPGTRHSYPVSSWTSDERLARRFAHHRRRLEPGQRPTVIHLQPGSRGVHIAPMATKYGLGMSEWLGRGNYEVVGSVDEGKRQVIHMKQVRHQPQRSYRRVSKAEEHEAYRLEANRKTHEAAARMRGRESADVLQIYADRLRHKHLLYRPGGKALGAAGVGLAALGTGAAGVGAARSLRGTKGLSEEDRKRRRGAAAAYGTAVPAAGLGTWSAGRAHVERKRVGRGITTYMPTSPPPLDEYVQVVPGRFDRINEYHTGRRAISEAGASTKEAVERARGIRGHRGRAAVGLGAAGVLAAIGHHQSSASREAGRQHSRTGRRVS